MRQTEQLINDRIRQVETTFVQLRRINNLLEQFVILEQDRKHKAN